MECGFNIAVPVTFVSIYHTKKVAVLLKLSNCIWNLRYRCLDWISSGLPTTVAEVFMSFNSVTPADTGFKEATIASFLMLWHQSLSSFYIILCYITSAVERVSLNILIYEQIDYESTTLPVIHTLQSNNLFRSWRETPTLISSHSAIWDWSPSMSEQVEDTQLKTSCRVEDVGYFCFGAVPIISLQGGLLPFWHYE
jgi:hypothetical protein